MNRLELMLEILLFYNNIVETQYNFEEILSMNFIFNICNFVQ